MKISSVRQVLHMSDAVRYRSKRDSAPYRSALLRTASSQLLMAQHERKLSGHDGGLPKQIEDDSWEKGERASAAQCRNARDFLQPLIGVNQRQGNQGAEGRYSCSSNSSPWTYQSARDDQ
jgi:hypothetical protein